jgi:hypothetical protein
MVKALEPGCTKSPLYIDSSLLLLSIYPMAHPENTIIDNTIDIGPSKYEIIQTIDETISSITSNSE